MWADWQALARVFVQGSGLSSEVSDTGNGNDCQPCERQIVSLNSSIGGDDYATTEAVLNRFALRLYLAMSEPVPKMGLVSALVSMLHRFGAGQSAVAAVIIAAINQSGFPDDWAAQ